ncbi:leucine rich repeat gene family [Mythimna separata entomopoxvirus 'L']|uniref:Leucine rich repeat gene family n=1 Tax=Mythimna separata entomopoxvirus 'L' TaxID=1293572 RepID=A0A916P787_9POXV|nr:leucine rich repeat gene family [Mythimna separata entomopoxvirus 'L']CCU56261.1 leucine rich repeat gene family [Mythimna separata entomopoxvirus 'L']
MLIDDNYGEVTPSEMHINLFDHQKRIIKYIYNVEKTNIELTNNLLIKYSNINCEHELINNFLSDIIIKIKSNSFYSHIYSEDISELYELKRKIYCINDHVGSGKSYSILGVIKYFKENNLLIKNVSNLSVIIVPFTLIKQWTEYCINSNIKYYIINRKSHINKIIEKIDILYNNDVIILSNTFIYDFIKILINKNLSLLRIIIDEPEIIMSSTLYIEKLISISYFKYILSSTYILNSLSINKIKYSICYLKNKNTSISIILPKTININLNNILLNIILKITPLEESIMKMIDVDAFNSTNEIFNKIFEKKLIIINNLELKKYNCLENKLEEIDNKIQYEKDCINYIKNKILIDECNICLNLFKNNKNIFICCANTICENCIYIITNGDEIKCPYCNKIENKISKYCSYDIENKKIEYLKNLKFYSNSKILIIGNYFTDYCKIIELSKIWFDNKNCAKTLIGNSRTCDNIFKSFRDSEDIKILFFNSHNKLYGYNMEYVTDIIMLTEIDENINTQIIGRAQRLGRKLPLNIFKFSKYNNIIYK